MEVAEAVLRELVRKEVQLQKIARALEVRNRQVKGGTATAIIIQLLVKREASPAFGLERVVPEGRQG